MTDIPEDTFERHLARDHAGFDLPGGESTSARLRQVQADLAASQADLTKALDDRDWWKQAAETAQADIERIARTADLLRAELATASKEVRMLRAEVARLKPDNRDGDDRG